MYSRFQLAQKYLRYYLTASNSKGHGIHSPFIFHFIKKVLNDKKQNRAYDDIEALRKHLLKDKTILTIQDFGAGSSAGKSDHRTISSIVKNAGKEKKYGQLLYRMVSEYQPKTILELGTSLGITTSYLAAANPMAKVITMEGAEEVSDIAMINFKHLQLHNIHLVEGNFDNTLPDVVAGQSSVDFCFIDGNHQKGPTEFYFQQLVVKSTNDSIFIFDDIHWSREMEQAWETIKNNEAVRCSIDLFFMGMVFFRKELMEKQHFVIRF